jgi:hypothetical protein
MGLDSVQLVIDIENYFSVRVPDEDAEKIRTVQDFQNWLSTHLSITNDDSSLKLKIHSKICDALKKSDITKADILLTDKISNYLDLSNRDNWKRFEKELGMAVYKPSKFKIGHLFHKPIYAWDSLTVEEFILAICGYNYKTLIVPSKISSRYEILVGIIGVTCDSVGADCYEVKADKEFVKDLGIN